MLKPASFLGKLCFAPSMGQKVRFTRPDQWLPDWQLADPNDAVRQVTRRYLAAYGPATRENYARWWGISPAQALKRIKNLGTESIAVDVEGTLSWMLKIDLDELWEATPSEVVCLLPAFDPYVIGAPRDEPNILRSEFKDRVYRKQGWVSPVLLVDGKMAGVWRHERKGGRLLVEIEPFEEMPEWVCEEARLEVERLAGFFNAEPKVSWKYP